jgi:hypothetical protein
VHEACFRLASNDGAEDALMLRCRRRFGHAADRARQPLVRPLDFCSDRSLHSPTARKVGAYLLTRQQPEAWPRCGSDGRRVAP